MRDALMGDDALGAPSVGTWRPAIGLGAPLVAGMVLGALWRAGKALEVRAPAGAGGVALRVAEDGRWVGFGDVLVATGEGTVAAQAPRAAVVEEGEQPPPGAIVLRADTDGTVYLSPDPGSPAFVAAGEEVADRVTVALVEVMKTFSPVRTPRAGRVLRVLVRDGEGVQAGAALFWIA